MRDFAQTVRSFQAVSSPCKIRSQAFVKTSRGRIHEVQTTDQEDDLAQTFPTSGSRINLGHLRARKLSNVRHTDGQSLITC